MENIGAVKELCKVTDNLGNRIDELEKVNKKLTRQKIKRLDSLKSTSSGSTVTSHAGSFSSSKFPRKYPYRKAPTSKALQEEEPFICTNTYVQFIAVILILIMCFCVIAMSTIYFFEWSNRHQVPIMPINVKERAFFTLNTTKESSHQWLLETEKSKSNLENSIAVQETKKETRLFDSSPERVRINVSRYTTPEAEVSVAMTLLPRSFQRQIPTSVPVLKPRAIGSPTNCRAMHWRQSDCQVQCCSAPRSQAPGLLTNSEDIHFASEKLENTLSTSTTDSSEVEETTMETTYQTQLETVTVSETKDSDVTDLLSSKTPTIEEHPVHQNQLKPARDNQRTKASDRNATIDTDLEKIANGFDQKMRNILKTDKVYLAGADLEKRMKRGTKPFTRKDLPKAIESLRLLEMNTSIGQEYCNTLQCAHRTGPQFSYLIPISKYMVEEYITLQFNLGVPLIVDHCQPDVKPMACPVPQNGAGDLPHDYNREQNLTEEVDPSWRLPIGLYLRSTYRFRVQARTVAGDTPCSLPAAELGHSFIEFILVFQRTCDK